MAARAVILDIDGTLIDSNDAHARAWIDAFTEAGVVVDDDQVRRAIGMGGDKLVPDVSGISAESAEGQRIGERRQEIFKSRYLPTVRPFPRVRELIERFIADGYAILVATSAKKDELQCLLERAGVADLIDAGSSADDADRSKPDPDIVRAALKRSGASRESVVMLGDTPYDVEAALRAGIQIVALECGGWRRDDLQGAADVYATPADLLERYDGSLFARLARRSGQLAPAAARAPDVAWLALPLIAIGTALVIGAAVRHRRRLRTARRETVLTLSVAFDDLGETREPERIHPRLGPRDRERLRRLIARTS
jgi:HAD superfamily hydrolase (TIGR01549 family)